MPSCGPLAGLSEETGRPSDACALTKWFWSRTEGPSGVRKTTMIVALARKLLIALWRLLTTGEVPEGVVLRPAV